MKWIKKYWYTIPVSQELVESKTFEELDNFLKQQLKYFDNEVKGYKQVGDYRFVERTLDEVEHFCRTEGNKLFYGQVWQYKYEVVFRKIFSKHDKDIVKMVVDYLESIEDDIDYASCQSIRLSIKNEFGIE